MRFLVDMPLSPTLAAWLAERGHDAVHAADLGLGRETDVAVMARAKQEGRTVITVDLDYPRLLALAQVTEPTLNGLGRPLRDADFSRQIQHAVQAFGRNADRKTFLGRDRSHEGLSSENLSLCWLSGFDRGGWMRRGEGLIHRHGRD